MTDDADRSPKHLWCITKMEQTRAYLERGRRFEHMPVLKRSWAAAFKRMLLPKDQRHRVTNTILEQS